jgi:hypothetical protein
MASTTSSVQKNRAFFIVPDLNSVYPDEAGGGFMVNSIFADCRWRQLRNIWLQKVNLLVMIE